MIQQITLTSNAGRGSVVMKYGDRRDYWLDDVDWGQAEGSHNQYSYYNQIGASIVSTAVGTRDIQITGYVLEDGQDTYRSRLDFLNTFISPLEDYALYYGDKKIEFRPDRSITWSREYKTNNLKGRKFIIQGTAPSPLFEGAENLIGNFDHLAKAFKFPHDFGSSAAFAFGLTTETYTTTIDNTGGFDTGFTMEITFTATVTNPKIYNTTTGKYLGIDYVFQSGDILTVCTVSGKKRMTLQSHTGETVNMIRYRNVGMSWFQLQPGSNNLSLSCDDASELGGMRVTVYYTPLYQEVE